MRFKPSLRHKATSAAGVTRLGSALAFQGITAAHQVIGGAAPEQVQGGRPEKRRSATQGVP